MSNRLAQQRNLKRFKYLEAFSIKPSDGRLARILKKFYGYGIWRMPLAIILVGVLRMKHKGVDTWVNSDFVFSRITDGYVIGITSIEIGCYAMVFGWWCTCLPIWPIFVGIAFLRMNELLSVLIQLHVEGEYKTLGPVRAFLNTLWHYVEIIVSFSIFYVAVAQLFDDKFGRPREAGFLSNFEEPLYFSFSMITTLGSDYSPESSIGKCLVAVEVFLGLFLVLIVIQRVVAASQANKPVDVLVAECRTKIKKLVLSNGEQSVAAIIGDPAIASSPSVILDAITQCVETAELQLLSNEGVVPAEEIQELEICVAIPHYIEDVIRTGMAYRYEIDDQFRLIPTAEFLM